MSSARADREGTGFSSLILLFPIDFHLRAAGTGSQLSMSGPSIEILIRLSIVVVISLFRSGVLIRFIVENTLSTSADDAGSTATYASNWEMMG